MTEHTCTECYCCPLHLDVHLDGGLTWCRDHEDSLLMLVLVDRVHMDLHPGH